MQKQPESPNCTLWVGVQGGGWGVLGDHRQVQDGPRGVMLESIAPDMRGVIGDHGRLKEEHPLSKVTAAAMDPTFTVLFSMCC